jgi:putative Ig domain-containing protein
MAVQSAGTRVPGVVSFIFVLCCVLAAAGARADDASWGRGPPPTGVTAGQWYIFHPAAVPASAPISFTIENKPSWATFDTNTGMLAGRPVSANAGLYTDVRISVTDGRSTHSFPPFLIIVYPNPRALTIGLTWSPPTETEDGAPLLDLAGYRIYRGTTPEELEPLAFVAPGLTRFVMDAPPQGLHYFAITAVNSAGAESDFSPVISEVFD